MVATTSLGVDLDSTWQGLLDGKTGIRELTDCITQQCGGTAAVFSGTDSEGYGYCLANAGEDLHLLGKAMTAALHGRGGGKPGFQQGRVAATEAEIRAFFQK